MMNVNRVWHLMCNHRKPRVHKKNRKRYVKWLLGFKKGQYIYRIKQQKEE